MLLWFLSLFGSVAVSKVLMCPCKFPRYLILYVWMVLLLVGTLSTFFYWYLPVSFVEQVFTFAR